MCYLWASVGRGPLPHLGMHGQVNDMVTSSAGAATCLGLVLLDLVWEVISFAVCSNIIVQHVI